MTLASEDDKNKIVKVYEKYRSLMFYIAKDILKDNAHAEDAVSESVIKLIHNLHKIGDIASPKTKSFVVIVVRNTAMNLYNKTSRMGMSLEIELENIADNIPQIDDELISKDGYKHIVDIIDSLPSTLRDVIILSLLHGFSNKEISEITGISYDTVRKRIFRAKQSIKNTWLMSKKEGEIFDKEL